MSDLIQIHLHNQDSSITDVDVNAYDSISSLAPYLDRNEETYVTFNQQMIMKAFSFNFYHITNGSHLYIVQKRQSENEIRRYRNKSNHTRCFQTQLKSNSIHTYLDADKLQNSIRLLNSKSFIRPDLITQAAHLMDIRLDKQLFNCKAFKQDNCQINESDQVSTETPQQDCSTPKGPSTEALPCFW